MTFVITGKYQASHGKMPRGRGTWIFALGNSDDSECWYPVNASYSEAKQRAVREAKSRGVSKVTVMP